MNPLRIVLALLALVGAAGTFLPWVIVPILGSFDGTAGSSPGYITSGLFIVSAIVAIATGPKRAVSLVAALGCGIPALIASAYALYTMLDLQSSFSDIAGSNVLLRAMIASASVGVGLVMVIGLGIVLPIACAGAYFLGKRAERRRAG